MRGKLYRRPLWLALVRTLPLALPAGAAAFGAVAMCLLLAGRFTTWLVLPLGAFAAAIAIFATHRVVSRAAAPGSRREQTICAALALTGAALWLVVNVPFAYQHIFTDRDPATYAVAGAWLVNNDDLRIPVEQGFDNVPGIQAGSLGFSPSTVQENEIYAQGSHILPAFLGLAGRLGGYEALFRANLLFGGLALLAMYAFGRLVMKPRWALLATATLAVSLPLIYFSRDAYTEPMALAFIFSCLAFLWYANQSRTYGAWILAGLCLGVGLLARIDTYLVVAAIGVFLAVNLSLTAAEQRIGQLLRTLAFVATVAPLALLAWLDLTQLSSGYYRDLRPQYIAELLLIAGVAILGVITIAIAWRTDWVGKIDRSSRPWRAQIGGLALATFFVFLASRSAWQTNFAMKGDTAVRSYAEHSVMWMTWYLGPAAALLGLVALVWAARKVLQGKRLELLPILCVIGACVMYLVNPNISSDQVWASRRFLPVILPGLTLMCFLFLGWLYGRRLLRIGPVSLQPQVATAVLATLAVIGPLFVSAPFLATRSYAPQLAQLQFVCDNIPANAVMVWTGDAGNYAIQPTQAFCGVPSFGIAKGADTMQTLASLTKVAQQQQKRIIIGSKNQDTALPAEYQQHMTTKNTITYTDVEQTYKKFPRNRTAYTQTLSLGELTADGKVASLRSPGEPQP